MSELEIIENNELIASFMECEKTIDHERVYFKGDFLKQFDNYNYIRNHSLKFNSDWNWLMLVIDRISKIAIDNPHTILYDKSGRILSTHICCSIETVYERVIEFIKWHNEQKNG
jgi:hypothetical protein